MVSEANLEDILKYAKVSPIMNSITLVSGGIGIPSVIEAIKNYSEGNEIAGALYTMLSIASSLSATVSQLDARSRFREYRRLKNIFMQRGLQERVLEQRTHSKCQRDAIRMAASDAGYKEEVENYFRDKSYKWYDLIPDKIKEYPLYLFNPHFWKTSLFSKASRS